MSTYVLIHGAWHGGWCWHRIVARLERAGHRVLAPDLAAMGRDRTPVGGITLAHWVRQIALLIQPELDPVVLVGHSRGGIVISEVAERLPANIQSLVYISAFLLTGGQSLQNAADQDPQSLVGPGLMIADDQLSVRMRDDAARAAFYGECSNEDVALARALLVAEPIAPLITPIHISAANFGRLARTYIECTRDRAITLPQQRRMQAALPCQQRVTLDTDHSPFLSRPDELTAALLQLAS
jgi:pimeloyl-ACP methyl ester carboxylesterase